MRIPNAEFISMTDQIEAVIAKAAKLADRTMRVLATTKVIAKDKKFKTVIVKMANEVDSKVNLRDRTIGGCTVDGNDHAWTLEKGDEPGVYCVVLTPRLKSEEGNEYPVPILTGGTERPAAYYIKDGYPLSPHQQRVAKSLIAGANNRTKAFAIKV